MEHLGKGTNFSRAIMLVSGRASFSASNIDSMLKTCLDFFLVSTVGFLGKIRRMDRWTAGRSHACCHVVFHQQEASTSEAESMSLNDKDSENKDLFRLIVNGNLPPHPNVHPNRVL